MVGILFPSTESEPSPSLLPPVNPPSPSPTSAIGAFNALHRAVAPFFPTPYILHSTLLLSLLLLLLLLRPLSVPLGDACAPTGGGGPGKILVENLAQDLQPGGPVSEQTSQLGFQHRSRRTLHEGFCARRGDVREGTAGNACSDFVAGCRLRVLLVTLVCDVKLGFEPTYERVIRIPDTSLWAHSVCFCLWGWVDIRIVFFPEIGPLAPR